MLTADDCDDNNALLGAQSLDNDCDMSLAVNDCDDNNAMLGDQSLDNDCDMLGCNDCNDNDANSNVADDMDCDGYLTAMIVIVMQTLHIWAMMPIVMLY